MAQLEIIYYSRKSSFANSYSIYCIIQDRSQGREQADGTGSRRQDMQIRQSSCTKEAESAARHQLHQHREQHQPEPMPEK